MDRDVKKMNWGCGSAIADDWYNVDPNPILAPVVDARDTTVFDDGMVDGIVANHSLQCLAYAELDPALRELHRLLRRDGRLRVLVPDIPAAVQAWEADNYRWAGFAAIAEDWNFDRKFMHYLTWGGQNRTCFTYWTLGELLERNGFIVASKWWSAHASIVEDHNWGWLAELDTRVHESIIIEAVRV